MFPAAGFTKRDVIDYYAHVAPVVLPHVRDRPLTLNLLPDGVEGHSFYKKQCPAHRPDWLRTAAVPSERHGKIDYCVIDDLPSLVWSANLANIELHATLARTDDVRRPDFVVFDLDPGPGTDVIDCAEVALVLHGAFDEIRLDSYAKTSGSKGVQVYVPLNGEASYEQTKRFARTLATMLEEREPERVVAAMSRARRGGKVFVDWSQNEWHKSTVCAYSLRARASAPKVSTPLRREELERAANERDPALLSFAPDEVLRRVEADGDLFAPVLTKRQRLPA
jgi:bifunctional non-homologous end joining protein LigD